MREVSRGGMARVPVRERGLLGVDEELALDASEVPDGQNVGVRDRGASRQSELQAQLEPLSSIAIVSPA